LAAAEEPVAGSSTSNRDLVKDIQFIATFRRKFQFYCVMD